MSSAIAMVLLTSALAACATAPTQEPESGAPASGEPVKNSIVVSNSTDINILDPQKMQATVDEFIWHTVFAGLTRFDATMRNEDRQRTRDLSACESDGIM